MSTPVSAERGYEMAALTRRYHARATVACVGVLNAHILRRFTC